MRIQDLPAIWRHFGAEWVAFRFTHAARMRLGLVRRRTRATDWDAYRLEALLTDKGLAEADAYLGYRRTEAPHFFFDSSSRADCKSWLKRFDTLLCHDASTSQSLSDDLSQGRFQYFGHVKADREVPPDWHSNPFNGQRVPSNLHWTAIGDYEHGDIKIIWEPSRFGFVYALVRAYWRTGEERHAELFWSLVEGWCLQNPPQLGANWKCGQEISFRIMAWCFGLYGFLDAQATTAERVANLARTIAVSGLRIEANIEYSLSQQNNHGISEAAGLWTIGALFPELTNSNRWKDVGRDALEQQGRELIYDDGSFSQHSVNYHRLMLQDYLWVLRLADLHGEPLSNELRQRVEKAGEFLYQVLDEATGQAPCYGQNDGSLILPLSNSGYTDFRPVIQSIAYLSRKSRWFESGPWDEDLIWLFGPDALQSHVEPPRRSDLACEHGGYYTLRSRKGFAFVRCASFRHRPSQADMLHVDLWWDGLNVAQDAGTYSYNAPAPWNNPLAHTQHHNTVTVDGCDQMDRVGRFLWLPWLRSKVDAFGRRGIDRLAYFEGVHEGYLRLKSPVTHRRAVLQLPGERWVIADALESRGRHRYRLHWLFPDFPHDWDERTGRLTLQTSKGDFIVRILNLKREAALSLVRADDDSPRGWCSRYYNSREPALSLAAEVSAENHLFLSVFSPYHGNAAIDDATLRLQEEDFVAKVAVSVRDPGKLLQVMSIDGAARL